MSLFKYTEIPPAEHLKDFIDMYWIMETEALYQPAEVRLYADGTTDIFVNMGSTRPLLNNKPLLPGTIYFGGTMTTSSLIQRLPNSVFIGIRFKPGGFAFFYKLPLQELTDEIIEFPDRFLYDLLDVDNKVTDRLNDFFTRKIRNTYNLLPLAKTVENHRGKITVDYLAEKHHVTNRTLERMFNEHMGITPKEFIKVIRFQQVLKRIRKKDFKESLSQLAYEMGYYDHAHLTNDVKRYSGFNPTTLAALFKSR
jgi:AraC-like DNA-binding protein